MLKKLNLKGFLKDNDSTMHTVFTKLQPLPRPLPKGLIMLTFYYRALYLILFMHAPCVSALSKTFTLFISPFGHAGEPGRVLHESYERAQAYHMGVALKDALEKAHPCKVILSRTPGQDLAEHQTINFAHQTLPDLFISISLFALSGNDGSKPQVHLYNLLIDPFTDAIRKAYHGISFVPLEQAHCSYLKASAAISNSFKTIAAQEPFVQQCECAGPYALPYKPLLGITAPSIGIEIGLRKDRDWELCLPMIIAALNKLIS
jgi:hypothetical protein